MTFCFFFFSLFGFDRGGGKGTNWLSHSCTQLKLGVKIELKVNLAEHDISEPQEA
jgi:hypothetical protein